MLELTLEKQTEEDVFGYVNRVFDSLNVTPTIDDKVKVLDAMLILDPNFKHTPEFKLGLDRADPYLELNYKSGYSFSVYLNLDQESRLALRRYFTYSEELSKLLFLSRQKRPAATLDQVLNSVSFDIEDLIEDLKEYANTSNIYDTQADDKVSEWELKIERLIADLLDIKARLPLLHFPF